MPTKRNFIQRSRDWRVIWVLRSHGVPIHYENVARIANSDRKAPVLSNRMVLESLKRLEKRNLVRDTGGGAFVATKGKVIEAPDELDERIRRRYQSDV